MKEMRIRPGQAPDGAPPNLKLHAPAEWLKSLELGKPKPDTAESLKVKAEQEQNSLTKEEEKNLLEKTLELVELIAPRRHLEYEVIEEADMVQVHVVNTDDGTIVRKIPSDEIVKLVEQVKAMLVDRFEVEA